LKIILAKHAGFCFGVMRAVKAVYDKVASGEPIYTIGPIIHNPQVVDELRKKGVVIEEDIDRIENGTVIIRSHGVVPAIYERIKEKNLKLVDATCPYVKRIHEKVRRFHENDYQIIIVGEREHPEVIGINGWCNNQAIILNDSSDIDSLPPVKKACVVAQTTITQEKWDEVIGAITPRVQDLEIFNTICYTTSERQKEAVAISKIASVMLVIGGKNSSNTQKLFNICKQYCKRTYAIETAADIPLLHLGSNDIVGITAGASTPDWIIKEVVSRMSEQEHMNQQDVNFMEDFEKTLVTIKNRQTVKGTVVQVSDDEVSVNIGYKSDGIIPKSELSTDPDVQPKDLFKVGDEIEVEVLKVNDGEGNVILSKKAVDLKKTWAAIEEAFEKGTVIEGIGKEVVKGGLIATVMGIRTFVPASQLSTHFVQDISQFVGQPLRLKIIEMERNRNRIVASQRAVLEQEAEEAKNRLWDSLEVGQKRTGIVRRLTDFGAFVDIGGVDGLIHVSDLSWGRVKHPSDVVKVGEEVEVVVLAVDREKERISLGYKQTKPHPWDTAVSKYQVNSIVEGKVVRIASFGAFVELEPGLDGLVHISQIANHRVNKVEDELKVGDMVRVKILEVKPEEKRISLSIREALPESETEREGTTVEESPYRKEEMTVSMGEFFPDHILPSDQEE